MPKRLSKLALVPALLSMMAGCSTMSGTPQSPLEFSDTAAKSNSAEDIINRYSKEFAEHATESDVSTKEERNALISKALTIMDYRYSEFVNDTELDRKNKDMMSDAVELSMNIAGAAVGAAGTKTILAAIAAGVVGINGSIDKNYFYEKTFPSLVAEMNADRKKVLVYITKGMTLPLEDYQWAQAVHDLIDYYNAGTLLGAISSIQQEAGKNADAADNKIMEIRKVEFGVKDVPVLDWLNAYMSPFGIGDKQRRQKLMDTCVKPLPLWQENRSVSVLTEFLYSPRWESARIDCKRRLEEKN